MRFEAGCRTTAMGIMPHTDIDAALDLALGLDIPFWPQLPRVRLFEDMYVQASEGFPGIDLNVITGKITVARDCFVEDLSAYAGKTADLSAFRLTPEYSVVYHRFLEKPLDGYLAIRGQQIGPVSFGFRVTDEDNRPIIYDDDIRTILFDFMQRKANMQFRELREKNTNAFVWLDEPGLGWVFSGLTGYADVQARKDYRAFVDGLETPKALHLCANVNLPYLLDLGLEILSFDAYQMEVMPRDYAGVVAGFLHSGGIISWGIVPVDSFSLLMETPDSLADRLSEYWQVLVDNSGISARQIAEQAFIAPARCCLKDVGQVGAPGESSTRQPGERSAVSDREESLVEKAFRFLRQMSDCLRERYGI